MHLKLVTRTIVFFSPLKGQSNEIFDTQFFSSFQPAWATYQWVKIISFSFSRDIRIFSKFRAVSYCADSSDFSVSFLKGQSNEIFFLFFHNWSLPWSQSNGLNYFRFLSRFCRVIPSFFRLTPRNIILPESFAGSISSLL